jgi:hypothetical protein
MTTTRVGKIGRLPKSIREMLGQRIENGEPGTELVRWLNGLSRVQELMQEQFEGRVITEQNLSEWKQTGHVEWLRHEQTRSLVGQLTEQAEALGETTNGQEISDLFASVLAAELAQLAGALLEKETDPEKRWHRLCAVRRELSELRRDDHRAVRTMIKRERWNREVERTDDEALQCIKEESKSRLIDLCFAPLHNQTMAELFGGGEFGKQRAELLHRIKFDLPLDDLRDKAPAGKPVPAQEPPVPSESELIQPNPTSFSNGAAPKSVAGDDELT